MTHSKEIGCIVEMRNKTVEMIPEKEFVSYRLIKLDMEESIYLLMVSDSNDEISRVIGKDEGKAENIFNTFVDGKVSPCTANDIFKDILLS